MNAYSCIEIICRRENAISKIENIKEPYVIIYFQITVELNDAVIFTLQVLSFNLKLKYASYICYCDLTNNKK